MILSKKIIENKTKEEINNKKIRKFINIIKPEDSYYLDDENIIIVVKNKEKNGYVMIHERLVNDELVEINKWQLDVYYYGYIHNITHLKEYNLFKVQNNSGNFDALYDYKNGKFVISPKVWQILEFGNHNKLLEKYNGILASFSIKSDYEEDDLLVYENPVTGEKMVESLSINDGNYYAILEIDGSIRGNKLFKGNSFSKITKIIDLDEYESLEEFKKERKQICNEKKKKQKEEYYESLKRRNDNSISPYLDSEVLSIVMNNKR